MIDELLAEIVGEVAFGRLSKSRRAQIIARVFFGLLGTVLGIIGAVYFTFGKQAIGNVALRIDMAIVFVALACFCLLNVALARSYRWPGVLFIVSFVGLFVVRLIFGK